LGLVILIAKSRIILIIDKGKHNKAKLIYKPMKAFPISCLISIFVMLSCTQTHIPKRESVIEIQTTLIALDQPLGLAIIAATPASPGLQDPNSLIQIRQRIERSEKESAFLNGLNFTSTLEDAKRKSITFLEEPSQNNAKELRSILNRLIDEFEQSLNSPLWKELVPSDKTQPIAELTDKLKTQVKVL
jgi:hypothetical protein